MQTIDTTKLAAATTLALPRKRARVDLPTVDGREVSIWLSVSYEESTHAYHGFLTRTVHQIDGDQTTLITAGPHGTQRETLFAVTGDWSEGQLDALYAKAYQAVADRLTAGDEKVTAILADTTEL